MLVKGELQTWECLVSFAGNFHGVVTMLLPRPRSWATLGCQLPRLRASTRGRGSLWERMSLLAVSLRRCFRSQSRRALLALFSTLHPQLPFSKIPWTFTTTPPTHTRYQPNRMNSAIIQSDLPDPSSLCQNIKLSLSYTLGKLVALIKRAHSRSSHVAEWSSPLSSEIAEVLGARCMRR